MRKWSWSLPLPAAAEEAGPKAGAKSSRGLILWEWRIAGAGARRGSKAKNLALAAAKKLGGVASEQQDKL